MSSSDGVGGKNEERKVWGRACGREGSKSIC